MIIQLRQLYSYFLLTLCSLLLLLMRPVPPSHLFSSAIPPPTVEREFVYLLADSGIETNKIYGFRLDSISGELNQLANSPFDTGQSGDHNLVMAVQRLAYHAPSRRLFALNAGPSPSISVFLLDTSSGALAQLPFSPLPLPTADWRCLAIHPTGSPLLVAGRTAQGHGQVASFPLTQPSSPSLTATLTPTDTALPHWCRFSHDGAFFYTSGTGSHLAAFAVSAPTALLTPLPGAPFDLGPTLTDPGALATDPTGRLFVAQTAPNLTAAAPRHLAVFSTTHGIPQLTTAPPLATDLVQPFASLWHPAGFYVVADRHEYYPASITDPPLLETFRITANGTDIRLTDIAALEEFRVAPAYPSLLTLNSTGSLLVAASLPTVWLPQNLGIFPEIAELSSYQMSNNGELHISSANPGTNIGFARPSGLVTAAAPLPPEPNGYVYALRQMNNESVIYGFGVDTTSGRLTPLTGFPIPTGGQHLPISREFAAVSAAWGRLMHFDPVYNHLYVVNTASNTVSVFAVNVRDGSLHPLPDSPFILPAPPEEVPEGASWACITTHPAGSPLIIVSNRFISRADQVASFRVSHTSITPAENSPYDIQGTSAIGCTFSQDGEYLYTGGLYDIASFHVDTESGILTALTGSPFSSGIQSGPDRLLHSLTTDDTGRLFGIETIIEETENVTDFLKGDSETATEVYTFTSRLWAYTTEQGKPSPVSSVPFTSHLNLATQGTWHPQDFYLAVDSSNRTLNNNSALGVYRISGSADSTTMDLITTDSTPTKPFEVGPPNGEVGLTFDRYATEQLFFSVNNATKRMASFHFDPSSGSLEALSSQPWSVLGSQTQEAYVRELAYVARLPDLTVTMEHSAGQQVLDRMLTLQIENVGAAPVLDPVIVTSYLPSGVIYQSAQGNDWQCTVQGQTVTCQHPGGVDPGTSLPFLTIQVQLAATTLLPNTLHTTVASASERATANNTTTVTIPLIQQSQTITFAPIPDQVLTQQQVTLQATASSGLPVVFVSTTPVVCTVADAVATLHAAGECIILAQQEGNEQFLDASSVSQSFRVSCLSCETPTPPVHSIYVPRLN